MEFVRLSALLILSTSSKYIFLIKFVWMVMFLLEAKNLLYSDIWRHPLGPSAWRGHERYCKMIGLWSERSHQICSPLKHRKYDQQFKLMLLIFTSYFFSGGRFERVHRPPSSHSTFAHIRRGSLLLEPCHERPHRVGVREQEGAFISSYWDASGWYFHAE